MREDARAEGRSRPMARLASDSACPARPNVPGVGLGEVQGCSRRRRQPPRSSAHGRRQPEQGGTRRCTWAGAAGHDRLDVALRTDRSAGRHGFAVASPDDEYGRHALARRRIGDWRDAGQVRPDRRPSAGKSRRVENVDSACGRQSVSGRPAAARCWADSHYRGAKRAGTPATGHPQRPRRRWRAGSTRSAHRSQGRKTDRVGDQRGRLRTDRLPDKLLPEQIAGVASQDAKPAGGM